MKSRKFRRKVTDDAPDGDNESMARPPASMVAKQEREKEKEKKLSAAGKVLLSFGDDEEAHGPLDVKRTEKLKASGVRATAVVLKATATQVSGPGAVFNPARESSDEFARKFCNTNPSGFVLILLHTIIYR